MNVRLPAVAPRNPLTTPDIKATLKIKQLVLTLAYYLVLKVKGNIPCQIPGHSSNFNGLYEVEKCGMEHLQRAVCERLRMSDEETVKWIDVICGLILSTLTLFPTCSFINF